MKLTKHRVKEMQGGVQKCIDCGKIITDYRNAVVPSGQGALQGFPEGNVYMSTGNPRMSCSDAGLSPEDTFTACMAN